MQDLLQRSLGADIRNEFRFQPGLWPIDVDPGQLELAILNLAINARDAMPGGGVLTIEANNDAGEAGDRVRIGVRDSGTGMAQDVQARAFEPFYSTKGPGRGTGLGLSQVHGFAEQSGGSVAIESRLGQGTVVTLLLPRARKRAASPSAAPSDPEVVGGAGNVLVVEDDDRVAAVVCDMIDDLGYRATRVANASEALEALQAGAFDLVFSDVVMPGEMNGIQLAAEIRSRLPKLPIVLTTGYSDPDENTGEPYRVLQKPYGVGALSEAFRAALAETP